VPLNEDYPFHFLASRLRLWSRVQAMTMRVNVISKSFSWSWGYHVEVIRYSNCNEI